MMCMVLKLVIGNKNYSSWSMRPWLALRANVARIEQIWIECRARYGELGPFLFGTFGAADAMFAPVVHRFRTYAIPVAPQARAYMDTMMALPAFQEWTDSGLAETLVIERFEAV